MIWSVYSTIRLEDCRKSQWGVVGVADDKQCPTMLIPIRPMTPQAVSFSKTLEQAPTGQ